MKYSAALLVAAGLAAAQDLSQIPSCAQPCLVDAIKNATSCHVDSSFVDFKCACDHKSDLVSAATNCVLGACGLETATGQVLPATDSFCAQVEAAAASSAVSSVVASVSSQASSVLSAASSVASSYAAAATSPSVVTVTVHDCAATTSSSTLTRTATYTTATTARNATMTTARTPPTVTAGAPVVGAMGSLAMVALAVLAL